MKKILVMLGPNLNMVGTREKNIYGEENADTINQDIKSFAENAGFECDIFQSNHEGDLVDKIQQAYGNTDGIIFNPAAYTHTSVAILDAVKSVSIPTVEVHISKVEDREDFRQVSYIRQAAVRTVTGLGTDGYLKAADFLIDYLSNQREEK